MTTGAALSGFDTAANALALRHTTTAGPPVMPGGLQALPSLCDWLNTVRA
ncbi:hypothetical protein KX928_00170 [Roseobacter sp. YSTF-M11]|uniref:Uncharacterized protein n=1 Tax=Roseobacter insulae TaxID=2859783 RepID=A0A9X1FSQ5_9RHOB|nr:hypothetical protein [Roseobacter insulae]MBW4706193.1 hypothetical protein [Roseobacter insulae]